METREKTPQELCETIKELLAETTRLKGEVARLTSGIVAEEFAKGLIGSDKAKANEEALMRVIENHEKEISRLKAEVSAWKLKYVLQRTKDLLEGFRDGRKHGFGIGVKFQKRRSRHSRAAAVGMKEALELLCSSLAGTEGTKTNSELPEWYRARLKEASACLAAWSKVSGEVGG